jgi:mono/diheme cytochrome c family protein/ketosteroid isomerase-like protein
MKRFKQVIIALAGLGVLVAVGVGTFVYSGVYNVGADDHHTRPVFALMQTLRQRSIHVRSKDIPVPDLSDEALILKGAGQYAAMCTGCHLKPGMADSEIRPGLYPQPPNLSQVRIDPQDAFWVIKHGLKMSAMPAWGMSHDDATIWSMVAFLQKLPDLTPAEYKDIVAKAPPDEDMDMGEDGGHHHHAGEAADEGHDHDAADAAPKESEGHEGRPHEHGSATSDGHDHVAAGEAEPSFDDFEPKAVPAAEAVAEAFHRALQKGDREAVLALLAPEAAISEGGHTQSRVEYASSHLGEDIAFLKTAQVKPILLASMPMGTTTMVGSKSELMAAKDGKPMTLLSRELLTLKQTSSGWEIVRVQWSSRPKQGD